MNFRGLLGLILGAMVGGLDHSVAADVAKSAKPLIFSSRNVDGVIHFYAENRELVEVTTTVEATLKNLNCSQNFPCTTMVPAKATVELFTLSPIDSNKQWKYAYDNSMTLGSCLAQHDDSQVYALPYAPGEAFRVSQGYHGTFSHHGPADEYAIDFNLPMGTPVHAARGGLVVKVKDDSDRSGSSLKYEKDANLVLIRHSDGTIGIYAHLQKGGAKVKVGDTVKTGDLIALSGNSGFTSGPHLHFAVFKAANGKERQSLPVKFGVGNAAITLVSGETYQAGIESPGKKPMLAAAILRPGK